MKLLYGPQFAPTVNVLRWMAFVPLMSGLSDLFGEQGATATVLIVETSIAAAMFFTLHLQGVPLLPRPIVPTTTEGASSCVKSLTGRDSCVNQERPFDVTGHLAPSSCIA